jgi:peptidoglycan/LPS O-acetylase OafA/YrhL
MCGALVYVRAARGPSWRDVGRPLLIAQAAAVAALVATMIGHGRSLDQARLAYVRELGDFAPALAFATVLTFAAIAPSGLFRVLTRPLARWLGDVSYGVFLWHLPLILLVKRQTGLITEKTDASFFLLCALVLPASLALGWLSRRFVEEPAMRWARRRNV